MKSIFKYTAFIFLAAFLFSFSGCSLDDSRDECCEELVVEFRYTKGDRDIFREHISAVRHFLFDSNGVLVWMKDVRQGPEMQRLSLDLPAGDYTIVSVANQFTSQCMEVVPGSSCLSDMTLELSDLSVREDRGDFDRLYYGYVSFKAETGKSKRYICDMSNHHCRLSVTVRWKNGTPPTGMPYTLKLTGVSGRYVSLIPVHNVCVADFDTRAVGSGSSSDLRVVHNFCPPCREVQVSHLKEVSLFNSELQTTFTTIRFREDQMPQLTLFRGDEIVTPRIDLGDFFRRVGWAVDDNIEQNYSMVVEVDGAGGVIAWPGKSVTTDWEDGGIIM